MSGQALAMRSADNEASHSAGGRGYFKKLPPVAVKSSKEPRLRTGNPKSRGGCVVCKIRRVKCGEEKPSCKRCTFYGNTSKRRSFHFFRSRNVGHMPANFEPYFWDHQILQFSHHNDIILDCLIALSAVYEVRDSRATSGQVNASQTLHAVGQYNKALRDLVTYISSDHQGLRVTLTCCLVFVWIKCLLNNFEGGLRHLRSGLKILQNTRGNSSRLANAPQYDNSDIYNALNRDDVLGALDRSFNRLSIQTILHGGPTNEFSTDSSAEESNDCTSDSTRVSGTDITKTAVADSANYHPAHLYTSTKTAPSPDDSNLAIFTDWLNKEIDLMLSNFEKLRSLKLTPIYSEAFSKKTIRMILFSIPDRMEYWKSATKNTINNASKVSKSAQTPNFLFLQLYHAWVVLALRTALTPTYVLFEENTGDFEQMLTLAAALISLEGKKTTSLLSFDMGVIPPLYFVALKCPVLRLRRQAIKLLEHAPEQEGLWRREYAVEYAKWKLELGEQGFSPLPDGEPMVEFQNVVDEFAVVKKILTVGGGFDGTEDPVEAADYFWNGDSVSEC